MNGILYVPYVNTDYEDNNLGFELNSSDYIGQLNNIGQNIIGANAYDEYIQNKQKSNAINFNFNQNSDNEVYSEQIQYYQLSCNFMDINGNDENIDNLLNYFKTQESFILMFSYNPDEVEENNEEVLIELKSWVSESKKVMELPDNLYSEEVKIATLPKREFKIKIGNANAYLEECIFYDNYDGKIVIFVKKIIFYN